MKSERTRASHPTPDELRALFCSGGGALDVVSNCERLADAVLVAAGLPTDMSRYRLRDDGLTWTVSEATFGTGQSFRHAIGAEPSDFFIQDRLGSVGENCSESDYAVWLRCYCDSVRAAHELARAGRPDIDSALDRYGLAVSELRLHVDEWLAHRLYGATLHRDRARIGGALVGASEGGRGRAEKWSRYRTKARQMAREMWTNSPRSSRTTVAVSIHKKLSVFRRDEPALPRPPASRTIEKWIADLCPQSSKRRDHSSTSSLE